MKPQTCYSCSSFSHKDMVEKHKDKMVRYTSVPWCKKLDKETNGLAPICKESNETL